MIVFASAVTLPSVLCANRMPYTPSVDFSFPAPTTADLSYDATVVPLMAHETESPFTDIAICCVTGWFFPAALLIA